MRFGEHWRKMLTDVSRRGLFARVGLAAAVAPLAVKTKPPKLKVWKAGDVITAEDLNANFAQFPGGVSYDETP